MVRVIRLILTALTLFFGAIMLLAATKGGPGAMTALVPTIIAGLGATGLWIQEFKHRRLMRKITSGGCPSCGYDRRGLANDVPCPECGRGACVGCGYDRRGLTAETKCPECGRTPAAM